MARAYPEAPVGRNRSLLLALLVSALGAAAGAGTGLRVARAEEAWEAPIRDGIETQDRERQSQTPDAMLRRARLLAARPSDADTRVVRLYLLARAYGIAGDAASAQSTYAELLQVAPRCYFAYHDLAMLALQRQPPDPATAEAQLRRAIAIAPAWLTAHRKLAALLFQQERYADAVQPLEEVLRREAGDLQARYMLAQALLGAKRLDEAEQQVADLVRRDARNPAFRHLQAEVLFERGRLDEAMALYRQLAVENPAVPQPLQGYLRCLDRRRKEGGQVDVESYLWALEGLLRIEKDPKRQEQLRGAIDELEHQADAPEHTEGPPTDEQLALLLARAEEAQRVQVLRYVLARKADPTRPLLKAVMSRLDPATEPSASVRRWALRTLGRRAGHHLVGLVRHSLDDPDPTVRPVAVDALVALGTAGQPGRGGALLALGLATTSGDTALADAARRGISTLANADLPEPSAGTEAARREVFRTWWQGPVAGEAKIAGLEHYAELRDPWPEQVLLPYLADPDPFVLDAAWRALAQAGKAAAAGDARAAWWQALPPYQPEPLREGRMEAVRARLAAWAAQEPR
jgi:tetratricopeptide (TPR) repeat protein